MFTNTDIIALSWFIFCWIGYSILIHFYTNKSDNIHGLMHTYRLEWMKHSILRDDRSVDSMSLGNLMRSVSFFASTSILITAALIPLLGYGEKASIFISYLPYTVTNISPIWEMKTLLLILIFTYAFFKYTWALRQYHYASIMILSTEHHTKYTKQTETLTNRNANILSNAARHFSMGIRSYYYAVAVLSWYLHPYLFIISTTLVAIIITRREFMSKALNIISNN